MFARTRKNLKSKKGFTLVELIVVIAILAILAAIAIPNLMGFTDNAKQSAADTSAAIVYKAWQAHEAANKGVDPTLAELNAYLDSNNQMTAANAVTPTQDAGGYITKLTILKDGKTGTFPK